VTDLADLFSGFGFELVDTSFGRIFVRMGAQRPPLLVRISTDTRGVAPDAPDPAERFLLVLADLPGYDPSDAPVGGRLHRRYQSASGPAATMCDC
jgi:haloacetate dehalogenase